MTKFDGFKKTGIDSDIEQRIEDHCRKFSISPLEAVNLFPVLIRRQMLKRFLAHVELFKMTLDVPGDIAELGVFRGLGLMTWANLLESYCIGDRTKTVYGFENWVGFGEFQPEKYQREVEDAIAIFDADRFIPWKLRVKLESGNIEITVPYFLRENPGVRFSLIHFDCDLYQPTKVALEHLWPLVSHGGVVLFDEYSIHDWEGETRAVDEYFADKPEVVIKKLAWTNAPAGYIVKE